MQSRRQITGFLFTCIALGTALGVGAAWYQYQKNPSRVPLIEQVAQITEIITPPAPPSAKLIFVGDLMVDRGVKLSVNNNLGGDYGRLFENIKESFLSADAVFVNVEGPVTDKGKNVGSKYSFAMDQSIVPALVSNNVKMVSFANNHVGDRSVLGFTTTLENFEKNQLAYVGAGRNLSEARSVKTLELNDLRVGFIACSDVGPDWLKATDTNPGQLLCSDPKISELIQQSDSQVDFLIFSAHWGPEYKPKTKRQQSLAYMAIDNGADMVIGHHPHVVQETEWYKDKFIAYSLGNFIFDQYFSKETMRGLMVEAEIEKDLVKNVTLSIIELDPTTNKYQPKTIQPATEKDFLKTGSVAAQTCPAPKNAEVNKWLFPVGPGFDIGTYVPKNLTPLNNHINVQTTSSCLTEPTAMALIAMVNDMSSKGLSLIMTSGFRTRGTQEHLFASSSTTQAALNDPTKFASVAAPGTSEHQLGVAVDFKSGNDPAASYDRFGTSPEYRWLVENAAEYGFIQSYQHGKESITGYIGEPWHWRYVGKEHAQAINESSLTAYEYLQNLYAESQKSE
jgi:poly-gamma-glutamate synthesis protein (capsule biosynthesis protein)